MGQRRHFFSTSRPSIYVCIVWFGSRREPQTLWCNQVCRRVTCREDFLRHSHLARQALVMGLRVRWRAAGRTVGAAAAPHLLAAALAPALGQVASDALQQMFPLREAGADTHFIIHTRLCAHVTHWHARTHKRLVFILSAEITNTANADGGNEAPSGDKSLPKPQRRWRSWTPPLHTGIL